MANIKQRKLRTALTIMGIMIGIMSVVTMLTAGLGAKKTMIETVEKMGSTREITVTSTNTGRRDRIITDSTIKKIEKLQLVDSVYPVIEADGEESYKRFMGWNPIVGVPEEYMENLKLKEGKLPESNGSRPELLIGNGVRSSLFNRASWKIFKDSVGGDASMVGTRMDFKTESYMNSYTASATDAGYEENEKKYKLEIVGEVDNEYDYNIYTDIDTLKMFLKRQESDGLIPGQPTDRDGNPYNVWVYSRLIVKVSDINDVDKVSKQIQEMGFQVTNNKEMLDETNRYINIIQTILGVIGAIAAIVAVIGIINTMMTAVYDRIKEIGLLKMLGSDSDDISFMFLFESAMMGLIGGTLGVGLSMLVDIFINKKLVEFMKLPEGTWLMTTPAWLILTCIAVSVVVAILAGAFPARWASRIKPLDAIAT
ncbi:MAG: ABC transporter permease [Eubacterium sp.]|nr:ABC transporter permease [Eubacterium sp.]